MELETIKEKRKDNISKLEYAKDNVKYIRTLLKKNLEFIHGVLKSLKKLKKIKYCFNYIKKNWYVEYIHSFEKYYEEGISTVERRIEDYSNLYIRGILERRILKLKLKQAQREFTKKQKSLIRFEKKYFNEEV